jgi:molybdopterin converting factor small subunit
MLVTIEIKLYASLRKYLPDDADGVYPVKAGTPVSVVLEQLNIPKDEARLIFINGVRKDPDTPLNSGDRVGIFPPIGGG